MHSRQLSFTTPILISIVGIFLSFLVIAIMVTLGQRREIMEKYHEINRHFVHNLAINYTQSVLRENDHVINRAATFYAREDQMNLTINIDPETGLQQLMQLLALLPSTSSLVLADTQGHYLRAPAVVTDSETQHFDPRKRPWYMHQADSSPFNHYTGIYRDYFTHTPTVTIYTPIIAPNGKLKGTLAFNLDLASMGYTLRAMQPPMQGEFLVVNRAGQVLQHPDSGELFKYVVSPELLSKMTSGEGTLFDEKSSTWYYYYSFTNPDWFTLYKVTTATLDNMTRHETMIVGWGFATAAVFIILFGLYLRHASRNVLMNIINAIKTGDVQRAPKLEAMLSRAIISRKEREETWVRQATMDALTNCKNRRAFDSDISALMTENQPFALALLDVDNFKSINDTWGHLNGDIVLRNVAREGITLLQPLGISIYRYGGEEFAVIFPDEHVEDAYALMEKWRIKVDERVWREEGLHVSFSAGLGEWNMEPLEQLISRVDEALYQAKLQGKNQIQHASMG
ncbi:sensor domain-containing diguanylate cyclase [Vagococcus sp. WN89Y]|uniref:sensor domain-containing diguanylate cyclase n=1 Tax=Vagococcus sp. WN89Y TaxID=3457258 RepID=UPI003FCD2775